MKLTDCFSIAVSSLLAAVAVHAESQSTHVGEPPQRDMSCYGPVIAETDDGERYRTSNSFLDMEKELGIDKQTREQVAVAFVEFVKGQDEFPGGSSWPDDQRRTADRITTMLTSVNRALGAERMEAYYIYMNAPLERMHLQGLCSLLPPPARLSSQQEARLRLLYREHYKKVDAYREESLWDPAETATFSEEDQEIIRDVNHNAAIAPRLRRSRELLSDLENRAAVFLSSEQLIALKRMHESEARDLARWSNQMRRRVDIKKFAELNRRVSELPRRQEPLPLSGNIKVEYTIQIDGQPPINAVRSVVNGEVIQVEADGLIMEIKPTLYEYGPSTEIAYFTNIAGRKWPLKLWSSSGSDKKPYVTASAVWGVRRAHLVTHLIQVSDAEVRRFFKPALMILAAITLVGGLLAFRNARMRRMRTGN